MGWFVLLRRWIDGGVSLVGEEGVVYRGVMGSEQWGEGYRDKSLSHELSMIELSTYAFDFESAMAGR